MSDKDPGRGAAQGTRELTGLGRRWFVSLTTFRADGRPVPTPVLVAPDGEGGLLVWTTSGSGKARRIRRGPAVTVAPCTFRGRVTGEPLGAVAEVLDESELDRVSAALVAKYGPVARIGIARSRRKHGDERPVGLRVRPGPAPTG